MIESIADFFARGGPVIPLIFALAVALWTLVLERYLFFHLRYPDLAKRLRAQWRARSDKQSWYAHRIRETMISTARHQLGRTLILIKALVGLCPLLGLLGTVSGMIHMFDAMAVFGSGNARAMATHISHATLPTLAGMSVAIAGLYFSQRIEHRVDNETRRLSDSLYFE